MKKYFLLLIFIICASFKAQEIVVKVDSATGGRLVIEADEEIIKMVNEDELCKKFKGKSSSATESGSLSGVDATTEKKPGNKPSGTKSVCGRRNDIPGFMIKVGEAKSEQEINTMIEKFRAEFPELRVEKSYLRPDWRLLVGDYFKKESGQPDLRRIKRSFPTAMLISWRVYCNRAK